MVERAKKTGNPRKAITHPSHRANETTSTSPSTSTGTSTSTSTSTSISILTIIMCMYIYIYTHMYMCIYIYIYVYIEREREGERETLRDPSQVDQGSTAGRSLGGVPSVAGAPDRRRHSILTWT